MVTNTNNPKTIKEMVILPSEIESDSNWNLNTHDNLFSCSDCMSGLCYITKKWGIIQEKEMYQVVGNRSKTIYSLSVLGLNVYCAKCGLFNDQYTSFQYDKDSVVISYDEIDDLERVEIEQCLSEFNKNGKFSTKTKYSPLNHLREKLLEYEKKHPIKTKLEGGKKKK